MLYITTLFFVYTIPLRLMFYGLGSWGSNIWHFYATSCVLMLVGNLHSVQAVLVHACCGRSGQNQSFRLKTENKFIVYSSLHCIL